MAIKYVVNEEKRSVTAILEGTKFDCVNRINNKLHNTGWEIEKWSVPEKYIMPNKFVATVHCDERDEFDVEFGKSRAKKIVLDNYYKSMDKHEDHFREFLIEVNGRFFKTPEAVKITLDKL